MPRKNDKDNGSRSRKRDSKKNKQRVYSNKHVRAIEEQLQKQLPQVSTWELN